MSLTPTSYRDRIYIVEDIILKLVEYGELNQTALISFCGLNLKKHRCILDELEVNSFIQKCESPFGKRIVTVYKPTQKGVEFCRSILEPYERMFPRRKESAVNSDHHYIEEKPRINASSRLEELEQQQQQALPIIASEQIVAH
jgi:predicted transcriptional regulator